MKICFLAGTLGRGGAEKQLLYMIKALIENGVTVNVLSLTRDEFYQDQIESLDVDVEWVGSSRYKAVRLKSIVTHLKRNRPDVLQSAHFYTNLYAGVAGRLLKIPSIGALRNDVKSEVAANGVWGRWQIRAPHKLIANSKLAQDMAVQYGKRSEQVEFVRNVIDSPSANGSSKKVHSQVNIIFVGRLVDQKQPETFVSLARTLIDIFADRQLKFWISGDGPLRSKLEQFAASKGLGPDTLIFLGNTNDLSQVYSKADILILTSRHEGVPNVILEAMSYGVPVIANRVGAVDEVVNARNGILVAPDKFNALAEAASALINSPERRRSVGEEGREFVLKNHSVAGLGPRLISIYEGIKKAHE